MKLVLLVTHLYYANAAFLCILTCVSMSCVYVLIPIVLAVSPSLYSLMWYVLAPASTTIDPSLPTCKILSIIVHCPKHHDFFLSNPLPLPSLKASSTAPLETTTRTPHRPPPDTPTQSKTRRRSAPPTKAPDWETRFPAHSHQAR